MAEVERSLGMNIQLLLISYDSKQYKQFRDYTAA